MAAVIGPELVAVAIAKIGAAPGPEVGARRPTRKSAHGRAAAGSSRLARMVSAAQLGTITLPLRHAGGKRLIQQ